MPDNNFKETEERIRRFWEKEKIYKFDFKSNGKIYSIDTPPPTVSGKMHMGHAFSYSQQDFIARYKRMKGFNVFYPFGTDDNGLATEKLIQKNLGIDLRKKTREEAVEICMDFLRKELSDFIQDWKNIGMSCDFDILYSTIDDNSRKVSQKSFLELAKKKLVYRRESPVLWDTVFQTAIAQAELQDKEMDSYFNELDFKNLGFLKNSKKIKHVVQVGERSNEPIEIINSMQWYVKYLDKKKDFLLGSKELNWFPKHMKHKLDNWINGLQWDWSISRQRHF